MAERIVRVDLCKGFRLQSPENLRTPLDTVIPTGIAAVGCRPAVVHHKASNDAILSRIDQQHLAYVDDLITVTAEDASHPRVTPTVAGLARQPLTGAAALPYPASALAYEVIFFTNSKPHLRTISGLTPTDVGQFINADARSQSVLGTSIYRDLLLGGGARFVDSVFHPFKSYEYGMVYTKCPNGEPSVLRHTGTAYQWPNVNVGEGRATNSGTKRVRIVIWEADPAFASITGETLEPSAIPSLQGNGPSLARKFVFHPLNTATMPGYGGTFGPTTHNTSGARSNFLLWLNDDMDSVEVNGSTGTAFSGMAPDSSIPGLLPSPPSSFTFDKVRQYDNIGLLDVTFAVKFTAFGGMVFDTTGSPFTFSLQTDIPRFYEGVAVAWDTA